MSRQEGIKLFRHGMDVDVDLGGDMVIGPMASTVVSIMAHSYSDSQSGRKMLVKGAGAGADSCSFGEIRKG